MKQRLNINIDATTYLQAKKEFKNLSQTINEMLKMRLAIENPTLEEEQKIQDAKRIWENKQQEAAEMILKYNIMLDDLNKQKETEAKNELEEAIQATKSLKMSGLMEEIGDN